jgi:hypothetical protein
MLAGILAHQIGELVSRAQFLFVGFVVFSIVAILFLVTQELLLVCKSSFFITCVFDCFSYSLLCMFVQQASQQQDKDKSSNGYEKKMSVMIFIGMFTGIILDKVLE